MTTGLYTQVRTRRWAMQTASPPSISLPLVCSHSDSPPESSSFTNCQGMPNFHTFPFLVANSNLFVAPPTIRLSDSSRFGHDKDFAQLVSSSQSDQADYVMGVSLLPYSECPCERTLISDNPTLNLAMDEIDTYRFFPSLSLYFRYVYSGRY